MIFFFFFCRRFVCKSAGTQLFYENTASALIATSLLLLQATERCGGKAAAAGGLCEGRAPRAAACRRPGARPRHRPIWDRRAPGGAPGARGSGKPNISLGKDTLPGLRRSTVSSSQSHAVAVRSDRSLHVCKSVIYHSLWPVFPGRRRRKKKGLAGHLFLYLKVALRTIIKCS